MTDLELLKEDPYYDYIETLERDAEFEAVSQRKLDDDYIYHIMGREYFLSRGHSEDLSYNQEDEGLQGGFSGCDS